MIKADQGDLGIMDKIKKTLITTDLLPQSYYFVSDGRACPSHTIPNPMAVVAKLNLLEQFKMMP